MKGWAREMTTNKWYLVNNEEPDVVVSSRVRLARNLRDLPFPLPYDS